MRPRPHNLAEAVEAAVADFNADSRRKVKPKLVETLERSLRHGLPKPGLASALKITPEALDRLEALLNQHLNK